MTSLAARCCRHAVFLIALFTVTPPLSAKAQGRSTVSPAVADTTDPLAQALNAEDKGQLHEAASAYRRLLQRALANTSNDGDQVGLALLGLERVWTEAGVRDSLIPVLERVLLVRRSDPVARGIQLRALMGAVREDAARAAYTDWRRAAPTDAAPYREYARLLLAAGRSLAADSVLADAARLLGTSRDLHGEVAQLNVALVRWQAAAVAFREAVIEQPWYEAAAVYALSRTPITARDSVRDVLRAPPIVLAPRRLLSTLELSWNEPRRAWIALSSVNADDSTAAAWRAFGERAEMADAWPVARDVWTAVLEKRGDLEAAMHAAQAALNAGDPAGALALVQRGAGGREGPTITRLLLPIEVAALGALGRPADAQKRVDASSRYLDDATRALVARPLVSAWLQAGDVEQAKTAAKNVDLADDDETAGWLALYEGDLATARKRLARADAHRGAQVEALNVLARTRAVRSVALGNAFLAVSRHDTSGAISRFTALADSIPDAAPVLLATAARLEEARLPDVRSGDTPPMTQAHRTIVQRAMHLWERVTKEFPKSPEAPEAMLAWAGDLRRIGDTPGAIAQLEQLLLGYPETALAPQARRELERLRGQVPPAGA